MYLHFEDWSVFLSKLEAKRMPHGDHIIKVFATHEDPRKAYGKKGLVVVESDHFPLRETEVFHYEGRRSFTGKELEDELTRRGFDEKTKQPIRALFRFANRNDVCSTQDTMRANENGRWLYDHPLSDLDGFGLLHRDPLHPENTIHLDIFFPETLDRLRRIVNFDNTKQLLKMMEGARLRMPQRAPIREGIATTPRPEKI